MHINEFHKSPRLSLIESRSSRGTSFGFQFRDGTPVMLSGERDTVLDAIYAMQRGEVKPEQLGSPAAWYTGGRTSDTDEVTTEDDTSAEDTDDV